MDLVLKTKLKISITPVGVPFILKMAKRVNSTVILLVSCLFKIVIVQL